MKKMIAFALTIFFLSVLILNINNSAAEERTELLSGTVGLGYMQKLMPEVPENDETVWSITGGNFPKGLAISKDGIIYGTPSESGAFIFTAKAENSEFSREKEFNIKINENYINIFKRSGIDFSSGNLAFVAEKKFTESPRTFEAWVKIPVSKENIKKWHGVIAGNGATDGYSGTSTINFGVTIGGNPWLYRKDSNGYITDYIVPANVKLGEWVHIAIVSETETSRLICYINGEKAYEKLFAVIHDTIPIRPLKIGGDYLHDNLRYFPGEIADIRIWSRALTQEEIQNGMNKILKGGEKNLIANWLLDNKPDSECRDNSSYGNNARVYQEWLEPEFAEGDYSIIIVPDIQIMTLLYPDVLDNMTDWIRDNAEKYKIKFMIQVGDLTETKTVREWESVQYNLDKLDGVVPYAFVPGNHDYIGLPYDRDTTVFNKYLSYDKYSQTSYFGGSYEDGKLDNAYYYFTADDTDYMVVGLEAIPRDSVLEWANGIVADNPERRVIVATHAYLYYNGEYDKSGVYSVIGSSGKKIWDEFASLHKNIIMVVCGHIHYDDIVMRTDKGIHGNIVQQMLADSQEMDYYREGVGMIALLTFNNNGQDVAVNWYSTKKDAMFRDWNQFSFSFKFNEILKESERTEDSDNNIYIIFIMLGGVILLTITLLILVINRRRFL